MAMVARARLRDRLPGYQVLLGADCAIGETLVLGIRGRRVGIGNFQGGGAYDLLRSHVTNPRLDGRGR